MRQYRVGPRQVRAAAWLLAAAMAVTGLVVLGADQVPPAPQVRMHAGAAWVASSKVGQLTLLDGPSAAVAARVVVAPAGNPLRAHQHGASGYALDRSQGSVVRVDGATLQSSRPVSPMAGAGDGLTVFPTSHALFALDSRRGLLARSDPQTLTSQGEPYPLDVQPAPDSSVADQDGRLWTIDHRTGDLVWFTAGARHARTHAGTPRGSRLTLAAGRPVLLDPARHTAELLDSDTGAVAQSVPADLGADDTVAVTGSARNSRLLISVGSRAQLLVCTFGAAECAPVALGAGRLDLGPAVEAGDRALVPDYTTGRVWIIDLALRRVVTERQLFTPARRFDLLTQDGVIFYNDPDSDQAGVVELDGLVRPIVKYDPGNPGHHATGTPNANSTTTQHPGGPPTTAPGANQPTGPPNPGSTGPSNEAPPIPGPGGNPPTGPPQDPTTVSIVPSPGTRGVVGQEFQFTLATAGAARVTKARWTFGDSTEETGTAVRHRWDRPGAFPVGVAAELSTGRLEHAAAEVIVDRPDVPPSVRRLTVEPAAPRAGQQAHFSAEVTGQPPDTWAWTVTSDRGTEITSTTPRFQHVFTVPGSYTVTLAVTAGTGSDRRSQQVTVTPQLQEAKCGDILTSDAVLTKDLRCQGQVGLTIAASNVTLDLGGHTVTASGFTETSKGILVAGRGTITNVTVRNGAIAQFGTAIGMTDAREVTVTNTTMLTPPSRREGFGITGDRVREVQIRNVFVVSYNVFHFDHGSSVTISGSSLLGNKGDHTSGGSPICGIDSSCVLQKSTLHSRYLFCDGGTATVTIDAADDLAIEQVIGDCSVTIKNSAPTLLVHLDVPHVALVGNTFRKHVTTLLFGDFVVTDNTFDGENSPGPGVGIQLRSGAHGTLARNRITRNAGHGIWVALGENGGPIDISGNVLEFNGTDGLHVGRLPRQSSITVSNNQTRNNGAYGIYAKPGSVIDGHGNTSSGNPKGCRGVVCR